MILPPAHPEGQIQLQLARLRVLLLLVAAAILVIRCLVARLIVAGADVNHLHHHRFIAVPAFDIKLMLGFTAITWQRKGRGDAVAAKLCCKLSVIDNFNAWARTPGVNSIVLASRT